MMQLNTTPAKPVNRATIDCSSARKSDVKVLISSPAAFLEK